MANPFEEDVESEKCAKYINVSMSPVSELSYSEIATKLLNENLLLTALELHTELIEAGREVPKLKEFFSNPGNFEHQAAFRVDLQSSILPRSSSQATLDSLDLTRYSEDGERGTDERVAVLEFELRKAKETISALRANLTVATESETTTPDGTGSVKFPQNEPIKPHEQRALNFLINEYLLQHSYKLTSITFADENENQDFEDWDDVGLNIPKPSELLNLYRDFMRSSGHMKVESQSVGCQTDEYNNPDDLIQEMSRELEQLKEQILVLEQDKQELKQLWNADNRIVIGETCNLTTPGSDLVGMSTENVSPHSATPECFELIDAESKTTDITVEDLDGRTGLKGDDDGSAISLADTDVEWTRLALPQNDAETDMTENIEFSDSVAESTPCITLSSPITRSIPAGFQREVLSRCFVNTSHQQDGHLLDEILHEGISESRLVYVLGRSLPRIIPNIILNKREEVIPLIIYTIHLHPDASDRDRLLQLLFNLKKRPQDEERKMILSGIVGIARCSGLHLVENEILPQCWEQLSHRHVERRLLVAESCSALAPYVSGSIRNSLMLSMLQQMLLEDRDETVREMVVKSLTLIVTFIDDKDKYFQCEELAMTALDDPSTNVVSCATRILMPVLAKWALDLNRLESHLLSRLLQKLKNQTKQATPPNSPNSMSQRKIQENDQRTVYTLTVLQVLLPYLVVSVATVEPVLKCVMPDACHNATSNHFSKQDVSLSNPFVFYDGEFDIGVILDNFVTCMENENEAWPELKWISEQMLKDLLDVVKVIEVSHDIVVTALIKFFEDFCYTFGEKFVKQKVKPLFVQRIQLLEATITAMGRGNSCPPLTLIPVYVVGILASIEDPGKSEELSMVLKRFLCGLAICGTSLDALEVSVRCLCEEASTQDIVISVLWEGVVHPRAVVRSAAASLFETVVGNVSEALLTARIAPALVTLASDPDMTVRTAALPALGSLITSTSVKEIRDKTYMQLQSFLSDPGIRDNHPMLLQLIVTMGNIVTTCDSWFREEVIVPQFAALASYTELLSNQTRRIDLATVLIEAFSATVYCSLPKHVVSTFLLPGLRSLESVSSQSLLIHHETLLAMIKGAESRIEVQQKPMERSGSISLATATANVGQGMEDMKQRVTKIFQKPAMNRPPNLPNLQGIFRKK